MAYKVFTNGSVLPASDVNTYLMDQSVMVFSSSATRAAALTAPVEGMLTWLQDTNKYEYFSGAGAWTALGASGILQVVSTSKTDTFSIGTQVFADVTGLSASITPSSVSSKVLVLVNLSTAMNVNSTVDYKVLRGSTDVFIGDALGSRVRVSKSAYTGAGGIGSESVNFLDSPATTSSTTYKIQLRAGAPGQTVYVNRSTGDGDSTTVTRSASAITLMEVAG